MPAGPPTNVPKHPAARGTDPRRFPPRRSHAYRRFAPVCGPATRRFPPRYPPTHRNTPLRAAPIRADSHPSAAPRRVDSHPDTHQRLGTPPCAPPRDAPIRTRLRPYCASLPTLTLCRRPSLPTPTPHVNGTWSGGGDASYSRPGHATPSLIAPAYVTSRCVSELIRRLRQRSRSLSARHISSILDESGASVGSALTREEMRSTIQPER
jgi:hypothetical protein